MKQVLRLFKNEKLYPSFSMLMIGNDGVKVLGEHPIFIVYNRNDEITAYHFYDVEEILASYDDGYIPLTTELYQHLQAFFSSKNIQLPLWNDESYFVVGNIVSMEKHPDSNHLHVCQVDIGDEVLQIVCGSKIIPLGKNVVVAKENAVLPSGKLIAKSVMNGIESDGMLCSAFELGLDPLKKEEGLLVILDQKLGTEFHPEWRRVVNVG